MIKISKKAHFFIVLVLLILGSPFYKNVILNFHTYYFASTVYELGVPADLHFIPAKGRGTPTDLYMLKVYLRSPVSKHNNKYILNMSHESIPEVKTLYLTSKNKKLTVDIGYKYNKYFPSNFDTFLIPVEIKIHDSNKLIFDNNNTYNLVWNYIFFKLFFYLICFLLVYYVIYDFIKKNFNKSHTL